MSARAFSLGRLSMKAKQHLARLSAALVLGFAAAAPHIASAQTVPQLGIMVPAYFDPTADSADWQTLTNAAAQIPLIAIMNPNSGPGTSADPAYVNAINAFDGNGGSTLGYVYTNYGNRSLSAVEKDIKTYFNWYPIDGIFLDEMATNATSAHLKYYIAIKNYIRNLYPSAIIAANPGTAFDQAFATNKTADIYVDEEDIASNVNATPQAAWEASYPPGTFAEMAVQAADDAQEVTTLAPRNIGWVYSTTLPLNPNPYANLPSDFANEVNAVISVNNAR